MVLKKEQETPKNESTMKDQPDKISIKIEHDIKIEYNIKEQKSIILNNVIKMLIRRQLLDTDYKIEDNDKSFIEIHTIDNELINIYNMNTKILSIDSQLNSFLNGNYHKIIITKEVSKKLLKQIINDYKNVEVFLENEMLEDTPSKIFIPKHELLSKPEKEELLKTFIFKNLPQIHSTDIMVRHFNANIDDIFRIIRPSITSGKNISYRRVIIG